MTGAPTKVTAIVSTYSVERFMRGCLENLVAQTIFPVIEVIIVDAASPQNERSIVEEFQQRYPNIRYLRTDQREPLYAAWNRAIRLARGEYLTNANTDDRHAPHALETVARALDAHPEAGVAYANTAITAQEIMRRAVKRGLERRQLERLKYLGMDEKSFRRGQSYVTLLTDLEESRVLDVVEERTAEAAGQLWDTLSPEQKQGVEAVAVDMWEPFIQTIQTKVPEADIVHDKFHVSKYLGEAVDKVRRQEHKELLAQGDETLKGTRQLWLYNPQNFSPDQTEEFSALKDLHLKLARAWAAKEFFSKFWEYQEEGWARRFFKDWFGWVSRSRLKPVVEVAQMLKRHLENLLTYLRHHITNAVTEGLNSKIQSLKSAARGFRNLQNYRIRILFFCGRLNLYPL
jgi:transposase